MKFFANRKTGEVTSEPGNQSLEPGAPDIHEIETMDQRLDTDRVWYPGDQSALTNSAEGIRLPTRLLVT